MQDAVVSMSGCVDEDMSEHVTKDVWFYTLSLTESALGKMEMF